VNERRAVGSLDAVCIVAALRPDEGTTGVTAIDKRPVAGPVRVGRYGLRGDVQADRKHHGGQDKALYAIAESEAEHWATELGEVIPPGRFGENLRISGLDVDDALIGERWRLGAAVEVEVTGPRTPCATFARWLGQDGWVRRYTERGRPGAYLRVVRAGAVAAGDPVVVVSRPDHGVSVARWFAVGDPADARTLLAEEEAGRVALADYLRRVLEPAAGRDGGTA
jgi:MOSC domain-containing protein YiiM